MKKILLPCLFILSGLSLPLSGQEDFIYESFREAWLCPESFDEFASENRAEFNQDFQACAAQLRAYFELVAGSDITPSMLTGGHFNWPAQAYLAYLQDYPGASLSAFLSDIELVAFTGARWLDTPSGELSCQINTELRQAVFDFKTATYLQDEMTLGKDMADLRLEQHRQEVMAPLLNYLKQMQPFFNCNYY